MALIDTPSDLLALLRRELDDEASPYLWSDNDLYYYMDEAQREFATETRCIRDSQTFTDIDITADEAYIDLDPSIVDVKRATLSTSDRVLTVKNHEDFLDLYVDDYGYRRRSRWESDTGTPQYLILNMNQDQGRFYPIPTADDQLDLTVLRRPLYDIQDSNSSFEIPKKYIHLLLYGVKTRAYLKQDYDAFDGDTSRDNLALWRDAMLNAASKEKQRHRRPRTVRYGGL